MPSDFTPPSEELQRLAEEINLLRRDFQAANAALGRIEKRLKATFPAYAPKKETRRPRSSPESRSPSTKSRDDLMADFDKLIAETKEKGDAGFESFLSTLPDQDVVALAYELGVGSLKTTTNKAREGIRKRIQESLLLTFQSRKDT